jgi:hypothetical protein
MSGADLTNLFFVLICLMTVLLVLFLYEVVRTPLELARATEQPVLNLPEPPPPVPAAPPSPPRAAAALPVRRPPQVPMFPVFSAGPAGQPGNGNYAARHASPYVPVSRPRVAGGPPWDLAPRPQDGNGRASLPVRHPGRLPSLWSARPASSPWLSAGRQASLPSGDHADSMRWHDLVHGDPGPRHQPAPPDAWWYGRPTRSPGRRRGRPSCGDVSGRAAVA